MNPPNLLTQTADRFHRAYQMAVKANAPPCLTEVKSQKSKVKSLRNSSKLRTPKTSARTEGKLLTFDLPLLTCESCPFSFSQSDCPHRTKLKNAVKQNLASF
ncbi:MAG: hypothetical protein ACRC2S_16255 [Waterburya sp.]